MPQIDIDALRSGTLAEMAALLHTLHAAADADPASLTAQLSDAVASDLLDPAVFDMWLGLTKDPAAIVAALRQTQSLMQRRSGIRHFGIATRSDLHFPRLWAAAGGAPGIAALMSLFSVNEVKRLCGEIRKSATAGPARTERQQRVTELLRLLCNEDADLPDTGFRNPDLRPLRTFYEKISLACTRDTIFLEGTFDRARWSDKEWRVLLRVHRATFETRLVDALSSGKDLDLELSSWTYLVDGNLKFAEDILHRLLDSGGTVHAAMDPKIIDQKLLLPLARRLVRRRTDHGVRDRLFALIVSVVQKYPAIAGGLDLSRGGLIYRAIQIWRLNADRRTQAENHLKTLLGLTPRKAIGSLESIASASSYAPPLRRDLFRLLVRHAGPVKMDVMNPSDEDIENLAKWRERLPVWFFIRNPSSVRSPPSAGFSLFKRYAAVHPTGNFIARGYQHGFQSILHHHVSSDYPRAVTEMLGTMLARSAEGDPETGYGSTERVRNELEERKKKAATSREWQDRVSWTKSAMFMCIAAGSYEMYAETLLWARRFNKDAITVKKIYASDAMETVEGLELLSGFQRSGAIVADRILWLQENVVAANSIVQLLLETAAMALREPGFYVYDWQSVTGLPARVVDERLKRVDDLQDRLALSDDEVFSSVWQPTLDMLLAVETFFLRPEHEKLGRSGLGGPLGDLKLPKEMRSHAWQFFDRLARGRDELWRKQRPGHRPNVVTLQKPFPRALPIQYLLSKLRSKEREYRLPYVQSRAKDVVFSKPDEVLVAHPDSEDVQEAIGAFIDRYQTALDFYVNGSDTHSDRDSRIRLAWDHATGPLGTTRMTRIESLRFWEDIFKSAGVSPPHFQAELPKRADSALPLVDADGDAPPVEWDPDPDYRAQVGNKSRQLPHTILDCMLEIPDSPASLATPFMHGTCPATVSTKTVAPELFWDVSRFSKPVSQQTREALAVAAILYINSRHGSDTSLLKEPYRVCGTVRFPALYLDADFLEQQEKTLGSQGPRRALELLKWASGAVPVPLLAQLASSLLEKMKSSDNATSELAWLTVDAVRLVASSDRPSLATPLIRDVVLEMRKDSAWHRTFLRPAFLKTLSAADARSLLDNISTGIVGKLREWQGAGGRDTAAEEKEANAAPGPRPSAVKITTVKMLAQLLHGDAVFISPVASVDILGELLANSQHIDVLDAVCESLLSILERKTSSAELQRRILADLETHVAPIAASLQGLRSTTEADWGPAEEVGGGLPEGSDHRHLSPFQAMLFRLTPSSVSGDDLKKRLGRLLVQVVEQSAANNIRWISLFVKKNGFVLSQGEQLPAYPVCSELLTSILSEWVAYMPHRVFEMFRHGVLANMAPPSDIEAITKIVKDSPALRESNAGRHWLAQYDNPEGAAFWWLGGWEAVGMLHHRPIRPQVEDGVTTELLREFVLDMADILVTKGDTHTFYLIVGRCKSEADADSRSIWKENCLPVIREILHRVDMLRTEDWQRDPQRKPVVLPDRFRLRMAMLPYPPPFSAYANEPDGVAWREVVEYVDQLSGLIDELASRDAPYHTSWPELKKLTADIRAEDCAGYAVQLGSRVRPTSIGGSPSLADHLRVELACDLFGRAEEPKEKEVVDAAREMLRTWKDSAVEGFRLEACKVVKGATGMREWLRMEVEGK